jgi:putative transposase
MPDHLHVLVSGDESSSLKEFVRLFKQLTGYWYKREVGCKDADATGFGATEKLWQGSYYDHVLRSDEDLARVASYILENPLRKGLVQNWQDYEFMGSDEIVASLVAG